MITLEEYLAELEQSLESEEYLSQMEIVSKILEEDEEVLGELDD